MLFEIWRRSAGYQGEENPASLEGKAEGDTLEQACENLAARNKDFREGFVRAEMTIWGGKIFASYDAAVQRQPATPESSGQSAPASLGKS